jgi:putative ABC transport system ATP-binding protein
MIEDEVVFKTDEITKQYGMSDTLVHALRGVTMEVPKGELIVLLGPSGSGKSTFLNIIGGLDQPTSAKFILKGLRLPKCATVSLRISAVNMWNLSPISE